MPINLIFILICFETVSSSRFSPRGSRSEVHSQKDCELKTIEELTAKVVDLTNKKIDRILYKKNALLNLEMIEELQKFRETEQLFLSEIIHLNNSCSNWKHASDPCRDSLLVLLKTLQSRMLTSVTEGSSEEAIRHMQGARNNCLAALKLVDDHLLLTLRMNRLTRGVYKLCLSTTGLLADDLSRLFSRRTLDLAQITYYNDLFACESAVLFDVADAALKPREISESDYDRLSTIFKYVNFIIKNRVINDGNYKSMFVLRIAILNNVHHDRNSR